MGAIGRLWWAQWRGAWRMGGDGWVGIGFYMTATFTASLALSPVLGASREGAMALGWISAIFAGALTATGLFREDVSEGVLETLRATGCSMRVLTAARGLGHWSSGWAPTALLSPLGGLALGLDGWGALGLGLGLAAGSIGLAFTGVFASAATAEAAPGAALRGLLTTPLQAPFMVLGMGVGLGVSGGGDWSLGVWGGVWGLLLLSAAAAFGAIAGGGRLLEEGSG